MKNTLGTTGSATASIIAVHPSSRMMYQFSIPFSLPALIARIGHPVVGYFAGELTDRTIRAARIAIVDIHWHASLPGALALSHRLREVNPEIIIIGGGLTASLFPRKLVDEYPFDFIIRGDGERSLPLLIDAILTNGHLGGIPNLTGKDGLSTEWSYHLSREEIDTNDYLSLGYFPSLLRDIKKIHRTRKNWPAQVFPFLIPFRGCLIDCEGCIGGVTEQQKSFGRGPVIRSPEWVADDLARLERMEGIEFVNCMHDFLTLLPAQYAEKALVRESRLRVYFEFTKVPEVDRLEFFLSRFSGGVLSFVADEFHGTSRRVADIDRTKRAVNAVMRTKNHTPLLVYNHHWASIDDEYAEAIESIVRETRCIAYDGSYFWSEFPKPDLTGSGDEATFERWAAGEEERSLSGLYLQSKVNDALMNFLPPGVSIAARKIFYRSEYYSKRIIRTARKRLSR